MVVSVCCCGRYREDIAVSAEAGCEAPDSLVVWCDGAGL